MTSEKVIKLIKTETLHHDFNNGAYIVIWEWFNLCSLTTILWNATMTDHFLERKYIKSFNKQAHNKTASWKDFHHKDLSHCSGLWTFPCDDGWNHKLDSNIECQVGFYTE